MLFLATLSLRRVHAFGVYTSGLKLASSPCHSLQRPFGSTTSALHAELTREDQVCLDAALDAARNGFGRTFPNPAVGCILVNSETKEILGKGFHPRAGYPHAEVFALLEAAGHVPNGVAAAQAVLQHYNPSAPKTAAEDAVSLDTIQALADKYVSEGGAEELFADCFDSIPVTAYVTLEPCCHYGRTPPCAGTFALSKVDRVVVGLRDPNPKVDGGGVKVLEEAGVQVDLATGMLEQACADVVDSFVKRITPKSYDSKNYEWVTGAMRRALRRMAGKLKAEDGLTQINLTGRDKVSTEEEADALEFDPAWMERLDFLLWQKELVNVRLSGAVNKKKLAKRLGERLAEAHSAHLAQTVGHTVLLYRPGIPPFLDLEDLILDQKDEDDRTSEDEE